MDPSTAIPYASFPGGPQHSFGWRPAAFMRGPAIFGMGFVRCTFRHRKFAIAVVAIAVGVMKVAKWWRMKKLREKWNAAGKDVVVLHTIPRGKVCPSLTPFSVKLETYFRMSGIKYILDFTTPMGPKNKVPWITLNGVDYTDTELIIDLLDKKYLKSPQSSASEVDKAAAFSMRIMLEEHLYWGLVHYRYIEDNLRTLLMVTTLSFHHKVMFKCFFKKQLREALYHQGTGRHSREEIVRLMKKDLQALSTFLGDKQFMLGDEPSVIDCSIFSCISQIIYNCPFSIYSFYIKGEFKNLKAYSDRMKERYWKDWDQIVTDPNMTF